MVERWNHLRSLYGIEITKTQKVSSFTGRVKLVISKTGERYYLKEKSGAREIEREIRLLEHLRNEGIPVALPLLNSKGLSYCTYNKRNYCIYPEIVGKPLDNFYSDGVEKGRLLGSSIGELQRALRNYKASSEFRESNLIRNIKGLEIKEPIVDGGLIREIKAITLQGLGASWSRLPRQLLHGDLHPGNLLYYNNVVSGFLDFENVYNGVRIFDVCYCGINILEEGIRRGTADGWIKIFSSILEGYRLEPLAPVEVENIINILYSISLIFMIYNSSKNNKSGVKLCEESLRWLYNNEEGLDNNI